MMFMLRSVFWLGLVFGIAPGDEGDPRKEAGARAANAAFQGAASLAARLPAEAEKLCRKAPTECLTVTTAGAIAARSEIKSTKGKDAPSKPQRRPSAARG